MCAGFRPPSVQPLPVRPAIAATVRASPATFGRIRRQSIENGLASRPPFRPCPRPSETRRALCKPSAPCLQRNQRQASAGSGQGFRQASAVATYPANAATVCRATIGSGRPLAGFVGNIGSGQPFDRSGQCQRQAVAVRPCAGFVASLSAPDSGQCQRQASASLSGDRAPEASARCVCKFRRDFTLRYSCRVYSCRARPVFTISAPPVSVNFARPLCLAAFTVAAPVATIERGKRAAPVSGSTIGKPWRTSNAPRHRWPLALPCVTLRRAGFVAIVCRLRYLALPCAAPDSSPVYPARIRRDLAPPIRQAVRAADFPRLYSMRKHETRKT